MRGKIPAQAPYEGGEPTMHKGSYSAELVGNNLKNLWLAQLSRKSTILEVLRGTTARGHHRCPMRMLPEESAEASPRTMLRFKEMDATSTPSSR